MHMEGLWHNLHDRLRNRIPHPERSFRVSVCNCPFDGGPAIFKSSWLGFVFLAPSVVNINDGSEKVLIAL